jgi:H+/Cl- antiporter ClcA
MKRTPGSRTPLRRLLALVLTGGVVGALCWPLTLIDRLQDQLVQRLPAFSTTPWSPGTMGWALAPVATMPLILWLHARIWPQGASSGIPQTLVSLENESAAQTLLSPSATWQRLLLWTLATLALFPLGREGPVTHLGAAAVHGLRHRWPTLLAPLTRRDGIAIGSGAGMAAAFNTPLVGVIFMAEELTGRVEGRVIPAAMVVCAIAAELNHLGGQPEFALAVVRGGPAELNQLALALPIGLAAGLVGAGFSALLLRLSTTLTPLVRRRPGRLGLALGLALSGLCLLTGGISGGDGEVVLRQLVAHPQDSVGGVGALLARMIGPCLSLGAGVPGGLIDPALALGGLVGQAIGQLLHQPLPGIALGLAAGLAGATQLPLLSVVFSLRLLGDQQLLPGVVLASALGAGMGRLLSAQSIYHALASALVKPAETLSR